MQRVLRLLAKNYRQVHVCVCRMCVYNKRYLTICTYHFILLPFNPLVPEFKIPAEPINAEDKMAAPRRVPISLRITLFSPFLQPKRLRKDFTWYDSDPGGSLVALIIRRCLNATEATMKAARSVKEDGCEVNVSVGCEAEG